MCERRQVIRYPPDIKKETEGQTTEITPPPAFSGKLPPMFRDRDILKQIRIRILLFLAVAFRMPTKN
jgi:hypothetical protein